MLTQYNGPSPQRPYLLWLACQRGDDGHVPCQLVAYSTGTFTSGISGEGWTPARAEERGNRHLESSSGVCQTPNVG
jgi:hypothetical protein